MAGDKVLRSRGNVLLTPEVADNPGLKANLVQRSVQPHRKGCIVQIEDTHRRAAVGQRPAPDLYPVLVHVLVRLLAQEVKGKVIYLRNVTAYEHVGGQQGPNGNVGILLGGSEAAFAQVVAPAHLAGNGSIGLFRINVLALHQKGAAGFNVGGKSDLAHAAFFPHGEAGIIGQSRRPNFHGTFVKATGVVPLLEPGFIYRYFLGRKQSWQHHQCRQDKQTNLIQNRACWPGGCPRRCQAR